MGHDQVTVETAPKMPANPLAEEIRMVNLMTSKTFRVSPSNREADGDKSTQRHHSRSPEGRHADDLKQSYAAILRSATIKQVKKERDRSAVSSSLKRSVETEEEAQKVVNPSMQVSIVAGDSGSKSP